MDEDMTTKKEGAQPVQKRGDKSLLWIGLVVVAVVAGGVAYWKLGEAKKPAMTESAGMEQSYKDGTYTVEGTYLIHEGGPGEAEKKIGVTITLENNIITDAEVKNEADDPVSVHYQDDFVGGYKQYVIGKNISEVHLSRVSGSSLTPIGFNKALELVKEQAKS